MKKKSIVLLTVIIILSMTACGTKKEQVSLYEHGFEVVALMDEMADNQSYVQMFTGNTQISEVIQRNTSGDYLEPLEVYEVVLQNDNFLGLLGNDETVIKKHLSRAVECAVRSTTVKAHELTHPLVYGWHVSDAPSDNKQLVRNLKSELMWDCFDEYQNKDWFMSLVARLENIE